MCHVADHWPSSFPYIALLVLMDHLYNGTLDNTHHSFRLLGLVLLHADFNDLHLHRRLVQGNNDLPGSFSPPKGLTRNQVYSASALAGLGLIRNTAGGGFPLFAQQMFRNVGFQWAGSILAFLAVLLVPIPFILERYGRALRLRSPWAKQHMDDLTEDEMPANAKSPGVNA